MLSELIHIARYRIETDASTDMAKQKVLHQLWATNTKNLRKINQIRREIEHDELKVSDLLATRQKEVERYGFEKQRLGHKNTTVLNRLMYVFVDTCRLSHCFIQIQFSLHSIIILFLCVASNRIRLWLKYATLVNAIKLLLPKQ